MLDQAFLFLLVVASLGAGGAIGLLSLLVMAIEIWRNDY